MAMADFVAVKEHGATCPARGRPEALRMSGRWATGFHHGQRNPLAGSTYVLPGLPGREVMIQPNAGIAAQLRLDSPDGKLIGGLKYGETTCAVEPVNGRHDLFVVFPSENIQAVD